MLTGSATQIWDAINDGTIYSCPSLLASFIVLSYADLKKYHFSYWFAFPAIHSVPPWTVVPQAVAADAGSDDTQSRWRRLTGAESSALVDAVQTWKYGTDARQHGFFLAKRVRSPAGNLEAILPILSGPPGDEQPDSASPTADSGYSWSISSLSSFEEGFFERTEESDRFICFADPSNYPEAPGWMLRNLLALVRKRWKLRKVQIIRYRDVQSRRDQARSLIMTLESDAPEDQTHGTDGTMPKVTGWERNASGKLSGRVVDLTAYMDPRRLAVHHPIRGKMSIFVRLITSTGLPTSQ
jgi:ubiquitin-like modifier-activating enzyme ATG7